MRDKSPIHVRGVWILAMTSPGSDPSRGAGSDGFAELGGSTPPVAMTIAGSDSGGGAGVAADILTFAAHGVHGTFALTAITAQSTTAVFKVIEVAEEDLLAQIEAVLGDFAVRCVKTGMLANVQTIDLVAALAAEARLPKLVIDPVMRSSSGVELVRGDYVSAYRRLFAFATLVTPNLVEAEMLTGHSVRSVAAMEEAARELYDLGPTFVVIKGGHLDSDQVCDVCFDGTAITTFRTRRIYSQNLHGTGCTLSAAIAANIAQGNELLASVHAAKDYVQNAIVASQRWSLGASSGPLAHFARAQGI